MRGLWVTLSARPIPLEPNFVIHRGGGRPRIQLRCVADAAHERGVVSFGGQDLISLVGAGRTGNATWARGRCDPVAKVNDLPVVCGHLH